MRSNFKEEPPLLKHFLATVLNKAQIALNLGQEVGHGLGSQLVHRFVLVQARHVVGAGFALCFAVQGKGLVLWKK